MKTEFKSKAEEIAYVVENKDLIITEKKSSMKRADAIAIALPNAGITKAQSGESGSGDHLKAVVVINTTNIFDSHKDVHLPGIWDKSLKENSRILHLQEHKMEYDKLISKGKDLKAYVDTISWKTLGLGYDGETQALIFDSMVRASRNKFMFDLYRKGEVDQHSVGMIYMKLILAVNDESYGAEFDAWEKYSPMIVNIEDAEKSGYFWAVTEAKVIEGSAVLLGSNPITPTLDTQEPKQFTPITEPEESTQDNKSIFINLLK